MLVTLPKRKRLFVLVIVALVIGYALLTLGAYAGQSRLIYPRRGGGETPELAGARLETIASKAGRKVFALYAPPDGDAVPVLVHFHGNGEELVDLVDLVTLIRARGVGVLAVEYPGYGLSRENEPNETNIYEDAEVALRHLIDGGVARERIVLSGQSLGSGVAVEMARRGLGARLLLFSPYTSMSDMANHYLPVLPNHFLVRDRFDNAVKAPGIALPVLVVHGTDDEVIPFRFGKKLAGLFPDARFFPLERGRHNDLFLRGGDSLLDEVARFCSGR
jgi:fermentation-respiration switch protein FrsA (DUF1100 family)